MTSRWKRWGSDFPYFSWSSFAWGAMSCIRRIDLMPRSDSGSTISRTMKVSPMIAMVQVNPKSL